MRQFACEWYGPATLTIGGTLQSALPRNELRITASMVDDTINVSISRGIGDIALGIPYIPRDMVGLSL